MDIATITALITGARFAKDSLEVALGYKIENEIRIKINEALKQVGTIQDTLFDLREGLFRLQSENQDLRQQLKTQNEQQTRRVKYKFEKTSGGAFVWVFTEEPVHYACPKCFESSIQVLQVKRDISGKFECPSCKYAYPINPATSLNFSRLPTPSYGPRKLED